MSDTGENERDGLLRRIDELRAELNALEGCVATAATASERHTTGNVESMVHGSIGSRRNLLRMAGTAAAGVVAGGIVASAPHVAADSGDPILAGYENSATTTTVLRYGETARAPLPGVVGEDALVVQADFANANHNAIACHRGRRRSVGRRDPLWQSSDRREGLGRSDARLRHDCGRWRTTDADHRPGKSRFAMARPLRGSTVAGSSRRTFGG